ncbi:NAD(P)H-hydrate dehydratase [Vogesella sp. LIG4]|uniref:NAD(P)H-hydrate dehydratase n=1 Tax=Vogesella sp. LIG4 TaxID=1192162 RepID=UPI00081F7B76|nr:NAD(P)H-hydrate dehydratase [Vogesella sp. LIG4]SCK17756.1 yjeF C-terminal region, hydroxyethylthiazole kinase-related/yjeF N-terminal region [Vogesella sp. LIG4]
MNPQTDMLDLPGLRQLELAADAAGLALMQRAADSIAAWVSKHYPPASRILAAVGPGNNGGDALFAACRLQRAGYQVDVLLPAEGNAAVQAALAEWRALGGSVRPTLSASASAPPPELLLDGLFGVGLTRPLQGEWRMLIEQLEQLPCRKLAIDVPSGLDAGSGQPQGVALHADVTLSFLCPKPGLYTAAGPDYCGEVIIDDLACPPTLYPPVAGSLALPDAALLRRRRDSHKGSHGVLSIIGGAPGMTGAALLAGRAALAMGAGKIFVHPLDSALTLDPLCPELMLRPWQHNLLIPDNHQLVVGPGLGLSDQAHAALQRALLHPGTLLLDADGLNLLAADHSLQQLLHQRSGDTILTPHPSEAARLLDSDTASVQADRVAAVRELSQRFDCVVLLKGCGTLLARYGQPYRLLTRGSPSLAVAGQGDVLAGAIAALLAQGMPALDAAHLAADVHASAGEHYSEQAGGPIGLTSHCLLPLMTRELNHRISRSGVPPF